MAAAQWSRQGARGGVSCVNHFIPWAESVQVYGRFSLSFSSFTFLLKRSTSAKARLFFTEKMHSLSPTYLYTFRPWNEMLYNLVRSKWCPRSFFCFAFPHG